MKNQTALPYTQQDVNLMLWQYAMGLLDLANAYAQTPSIKQDVELLDILVSTRSKHIATHFKLSPDFQITFEKQGDTFKANKRNV